MFSDPFQEYSANVWDMQIRVKSMVGDIPWSIDHGSEKFRLISLDDTLKMKERRSSEESLTVYRSQSRRLRKTSSSNWCTYIKIKSVLQ